MDRGAWWAKVHGVAKSWTRLKWLSMHPRGRLTPPYVWKWDLPLFFFCYLSWLLPFKQLRKASGRGPSNPSWAFYCSLCCPLCLAFTAPALGCQALDWESQGGMQLPASLGPSSQPCLSPSYPAQVPSALRDHALRNSLKLPSIRGLENDRFSVLSQIQGPVRHWVQSRPPFQEGESIIFIIFNWSKKL